MSSFINVSLFIVFVFATLTVFSTIEGAFEKPTPQQIEEAKSIQRCKLIEENINNGVFQENTNKLNCDGVIRNITVSDYNNFMNISTK